MVKRKNIWVFLLFLAILPALGIKPLKNLQVSCRDKVYTIDNVSTVDELVRSLEKESGIPHNDILSGKVLHKGRILEQKDLLRNVGVLDGSRIVVVTDNHQMKPREFLAMVLFTLSEEGWEKFLQTQDENIIEHVVEKVSAEWKEAQFLKRDDVSAFLRNGLDLSYHALRACWDNPSFRNSLSDPDQIEAYRKVVSLHLSKKILSDIPGAAKIVKSPEKWREKVLRFTSSIIRIGDTILDGILDLLLDVLKGAGRTTFPEDRYRRETESQSSTMDDPFLANNILFDLSDSESED
eukprot:scaffold1888_cov120-Cylindrotheca_fusiformis.AAC.16